eukprot:CAMPEP_0176019594 /NCGR_PEP_ID=MMETSP0120_2-20121206/9470_1 /TAXON_ID=160619 /ORGANISM="Kryptoperidinium foliaceum, Strain CCMP 1326" /LENGTH=242 /DNA_ID=CAMNT_0017352673 /DNA_START=19 /DNA_END=746 /DNA_ORIENTATION=-
MGAALTKALPCQWCGQSPNEGVGISEVVSHFSSDRHPDEAGYAHECNDEETGEPAALTVVHSPLSAQKAACKVSSVAVIGSFVRSAYSSGWPCKFFVQSSGEFVDAMLRVDIDLTTLAVLNAADEAASKCIRRGGDLDDVDTLMRLTASQVESVLVGDAKETLRLVPAKVLEQVRPEDLAVPPPPPAEGRLRGWPLQLQPACAVHRGEGQLHGGTQLPRVDGQAVAGGLMVPSALRRDKCAV